MFKTKEFVTEIEKNTRDTKIMRYNRFKTVVLLMVVGFAMAGCQQPAITYETSMDSTENTISIAQLAAKLETKVTEITPTYTKLQNFDNTIMIFTHTHGQFFVNGKLGGNVGRVEKRNGQVLVSETLVPRIRQALSRPRQFSNISGRVVLDAGHGGKDTGAIGCNGFYEKGVNLKIAKKAAYLLRQKGIEVIMVRNDDTFVELNRRADIANRNRPDLFVSIHSDSGLNRSMHGFTIYAARAASQNSLKSAAIIEKAMRRTGLTSNGVRKANYRVLVRTRCPAVLIEMGYLSNYREAALLVDERFQNQVARVIANGIYKAVKNI